MHLAFITHFSIDAFFQRYISLPILGFFVPAQQMIIYANVCSL